MLDTEEELKKKDGWILVTKGVKPELKQPVTTYTSNDFSLLSINKDTEKNTLQLQTNALPMSDNRPSKQNNKQRKQEIIQKHQRDTLKRLRESEEIFLDQRITRAKDEHTTMEKDYKASTWKIAINKAHAERSKPTVGMWQQG